MSNDRIKKILI